MATATAPTTSTGAAEELIVKATPSIDIPADVQAKIGRLMQSIKANITQKTDAYLERVAANAGLEAGGPTLPGGYQYQNIVAVGPFQGFGGLGPYRPSKIIAAGELAVIFAIHWNNPAPSPGGGLPGTIIMGGRNWRLRFETMNLSTVSNGPDQTLTGTFPGVAPVVSVFPFAFVPTDPGVNPNLFESNITFDLTLSGQPIAAFATQWFDPEGDPPFLGLPGKPAGWQNGPVRYMAYRR